MALFNQYERLDGRRSTSQCSTVTLTVFVALCLVGIWMITSSNDIPINVSFAKKSEVEEDRSLDAANSIKKDASGNQNIIAETTDATMKNVTAEVDNYTKQTNTTKGEVIVEENNTTKPTDELKGEANYSSKNQPFDDMNQKPDGTNDGQGKNIEQNAEESLNDIKEKGGDTPKYQAYDDENGKLESVEMAKEYNKTAENDSNKTLSDDNGNAEVTDLVKENAEGIKSSDETKKISNNNTTKTGEKVEERQSSEAFPSGQAELLNETATQNGAFSTQAAESKKEKKMRDKKNKDEEYSWKLCNSSAGADYIPCLDNEDAIRKLQSTKHYEHRERHCPDEAPTCLVQLPEAYKQPIQWPHSRDKIWYHNVPHTKLAASKGHQNWVKVSGEYLTFPGGGTQFKHGALHYIEVIQEALPEVGWGRRSRVVLDVGCGVASFGGYLFDKDALTMSFAPKDEHEAQVQFALERGIPAISAVMGTKRLPFPSNVFDAVHCARCRVPWHVDGGMLLLELNRLLRPGGFFVWSATPIYRKIPEDVAIWHEMAALTKSMCWDMIKKIKDSIDQVGLVVFKKPSSNDCYKKRKQTVPPLCEGSDDPNAAWNITLQACMHEIPTNPSIRGARWPEQWPERLEKPPYWLDSSQVGVYGKPAPDDFVADYEHWKNAVNNSYLNGMGIDWSNVRNVMDMRAVYGGFAAALRDMKVWVMNVVMIDSPDTLPVIYERGLFGIYHDWCESFSTYPRSYDLLHADHLLSKLRARCKLLPVMVEVDRILRPEGKLIVRDNTETISEVESIAKSLHWEVRMTLSKQKQGLLCVKKTMWRPTQVEAR